MTTLVQSSNDNKDVVTLEESSLSRRDFMKFVGASVAGMLLASTGISAIAPEDALAASGTRKCYLIGTSNVPVYSKSNLTGRIGAIYSSDEITVITVTSSYCYVSYPLTKGGTKKGYIATTSILTGTTGTQYTAKGKVTTYKRPSGDKYGSISSGDKVTVLGSSGGMVQIKYPLSSGGYKYAFISASDYSNYIIDGGASTNSRYQKVSSIASKYNNTYYTSTGKATDSSGSKSKSWQGAIQCKGYASWVFYQVTGVKYIGTTNSTYKINYSSSNTTCIGSKASLTASTAKSLLSSAQAGDFIQMKRRSSGGPHSAVVISANISSVSFTDANSDSQCIIRTHTLTWSQFASANSAASLYRAK